MSNSSSFLEIIQVNENGFLGRIEFGDSNFFDVNIYINQKIVRTDYFYRDDPRFFNDTTHFFDIPLLDESGYLNKINVNVGGYFEKIFWRIGFPQLINITPINMRELNDFFIGYFNAPIPPIDYIKHVGGPTAEVNGYFNVGLHTLFDFVMLRFISTQSKTVSTMVDLGCGCGRISSIIGAFFADKISYYGYDVWKEGIEWAKSNLSSIYPNIHFELLGDSQSITEYASDSAYQLSHQDNSVDQVFATSVFTHLSPDAAKLYLKEIFRILKPGGYAYLTFFILENYDVEFGKNFKGEGKERILTQEAITFKLSNYRGKYIDIYYRLDSLKNMLQESGLCLKSVLKGFWKGGNNNFSELRPVAGYQDVALLIKELP